MVKGIHPLVFFHFREKGKREKGKIPSIKKRMVGSTCISIPISQSLKRNEMRNRRREMEEEK
jgi:hypothetical protein